MHKIGNAVLTTTFLFASSITAADSLRAEYDAKARELGITLDELYYTNGPEDTDASDVLLTKEPFHGSAPWSEVVRDGNLVHFLYSNPPRLERYDLELGSFLSPISLSEMPNSFGVDQTDYFVAYDRSIYRIPISGGAQVHLGNAPASISGVLVDENFVFYTYGSNVVCRNKETGALASDRATNYTPRGTDLSRSMSAIFGRTSGISPSDIVRVTYDAFGSLSGSVDSPYHGAYPGASWVRVLPDDVRVVDSAGMVYRGSDLRYVGSFGGAINDVDFHGNNPLVRRGNTLTLLDQSFGPIGSHTPGYTVLDYHLHGDEVVCFYREGDAILTDTLSLSVFNPPLPGPPVNPLGIAYQPDTMLMGDDGIVYLLHKATRSVFRWSVPEGSYLESIALAEVPQYMALSNENSSLYFAYANGRVTKKSTILPSSEEFLINLPTAPCGLSTAGEYIFTCDSSGAWFSHTIFNHTGEQVGYKEWNYRSRVYVWAPATRKMYHFRDGTSPNDILWEEIGVDGEIGLQRDSPNHGGVDVSLPLSVSPDGGRVLTGGGVIRDGATLAVSDSLSNSINAATWLGNTLLTGRGLDGNTEIQKWGDLYSVDDHATIKGTPIELFTFASEIIAVVMDGAHVRFARLDSELNVLDVLPIPTYSAWVFE